MQQEKLKKLRDDWMYVKIRGEPLNNDNAASVAVAGPKGKSFNQFIFYLKSMTTHSPY